MVHRKRKASSGDKPFPHANGNSATSNSHSANHSDSHDVWLTRPHKNARQAENFGIVLREFYPPEISNARCEAYNNGTLERPIESLRRACEETAEACQKISVGNAVVHWFKGDLRLRDNRALKMASDRAKEGNIPLIGLYIMSPQDLTAHLSSPARVDFILRTLKLIQKGLAELDIPLYMEMQEIRRNIPNRIIELCQKWEANHIFTNIEYEVDELRRETKLVRMCCESRIAFEPVHDSCVVLPGSLASQQGRQYSAYSPWYRAWLAFIKQYPAVLEIVGDPGANSRKAHSHFKGLFDCKLPDAPKNKVLPTESKKRLHGIWPEGEHVAHECLEKFLESKSKDYDHMRNMLNGDYTSKLSPYLAIGALSARTVVAKAREANKGSLDRGNGGYVSWISEVAWRDFYRHVLVHWPFIWYVTHFRQLSIARGHP
jgi:deoxyribodipyrimidine photo-lyase